MFEDFLSWEKQTESFIEELKEKDSLLYARIYDVLRVLDFISAREPKDVDDDMSIIFETGYAYLYNFVNDIKLYLENSFNNSLTELLKYEDLVNFSLYVCELKDNLIDDNQYDELKSEQFEFILSDIDERIAQKNCENMNDAIEDYNNRLLSVMPMDKMYKCVDEIFVDVYEALKMD